MKNVLTPLIEAFSALPGIGPRSATRLAYYLLHQHREKADDLASAIQRTLQNVVHCQKCNTFTDQNICDICLDPSREQDTLCIVEMPIDLYSLENTHTYKGLYFVLMGAISPLDKIFAENLAFDKLIELIQTSSFKEIIIATNFTTAGETTAHYISELLQNQTLLTEKSQQMHITRLARGMPKGNELEYTDVQTIAASLFDRRVLL